MSPMAMGLRLLLCLAVVMPTLGLGEEPRRSPEDDRAKLVKHFRDRYPDIRLDDYVHGALAFDPDARARYDAAMAQPAFRSQVEQGENLWHTPFRNGRTYADCLPNGGRRIAGNYPLFDENRGRVVTFEDALNDCRVANGEAAYEPGDATTLGVLGAYARSLSDGMPMNVQVTSASALRAFEDGKRRYYARMGQRNYACAGCHVDYAGYRLRDVLLSPVVGQAAHWPVFRGGHGLETLQARYQRCYRLALQMPEPLGGEALNNLEYFHSYLSNGLELKANVYRE